MSVPRTAVRAHMLLRTTIRNSPQSLPFLTQHRSASGTSDWSGRQGQEHVTNRKDELDVQSGASQSGKRERVADDENASQGTSEKDSGNQNEQAKKDHPEAPGPVIGMNDERGGVSLRPRNPIEQVCRLGSRRVLTISRRAIQVKANQQESQIWHCGRLRLHSVAYNSVAYIGV